MFRGTAAAALFGLTLVGCTAIAALPANAQSDVPNVLIMGEDSDRDTVPRNSRVFTEVVDALANQLHSNGYNVFDETAISMDTFVQDRTRRTDQEIIDVARSVPVPIDTVAIFSIYPSTTKLDYTTKARLRIKGRLLDPRSGQQYGNFQVVSPEEYRLPVTCPRECLLENLAEHGRTLGNDLGDVLSEKLNNMWESGGLGGSGGGGGSTTAALTTSDASGDPGFVRMYELVFDGFTDQDMLDLEEYLVVFSGYKSHRPIEARPTYHAYQYESGISHAKLNRNVTKMLNHAGMRGRIKSTGNKIVVEKVGGRKKHPLDPSEW